jgi:hypothetical protein
LQREAADEVRVPERQLLGMMLPPEKPATWADAVSSARSTPAAASAIASTVARASGIAVRPAPRLSNAVSR